MTDLEVRARQVADGLVGKRVGVVVAVLAGGTAQIRGAGRTGD